ncbi:MAG: hypothetical protein Q9204_006727 [Flavoplaca sp. TL-2023a]
MKTAQDVPAAGSPSGGSMGGGMDQATTGDDNKQLVVSDRRFEENGNRRIELKIEFGESHVYQTWEIRDGKLEEVPGGTGGTAMPLSKSGASAADGASSVSGFDDLTGGSPSPSGAPGSTSGSISTTNGDTTQVDYPATNSTSSNLSLGGNQTDTAMGTDPGASDDSSSAGSTAMPETSSDGASSAAGGMTGSPGGGMRGNTASDMMGKPDTAATGSYKGNQQARPGAATGSSKSKLRLRRSNGKNRRAV